MEGRQTFRSIQTTPVLGNRLRLSHEAAQKRSEGDAGSSGICESKYLFRFLVLSVLHCIIYVADDGL